MIYGRAHMSTEQQSHYNEEFRRSCTKLAVDSDQPVNKTATELGNIFKEYQENTQSGIIFEESKSGCFPV